MSAIQQVFSVGRKSGNYWITYLSAGATALSASDAIFDSSGNVYAAGWLGSSTSAFVAKFNSTGTLQLQKTIDHATAATTSTNVLVNNSNGKIHVLTAGGSLPMYLQFDSSWNLLVDVKVTDTVSRQFVIDSSDNIYIGSSYNNGTHVVKKTDSSGATVFTTTVDCLTSVTGDICIDSSGDVFYCGSRSETGPVYSSYLLKVNGSSGAITWQTSFDASVSNIRTSSDGSNVFVAGGMTRTVQNGLLAKFNSSGVLQWQKYMEGCTSLYDVFAYSSDEIYVTGQMLDTDSTYYIYVARFNGSGGLVWQRKFSQPAANDYSSSIKADADSILITGRTEMAGVSKFMVARLPKDGELYGTYGTFVYEPIDALFGDTAVSTSAVSKTAVTTNTANTSDTHTIADTGYSQTSYSVR